MAISNQISRLTTLRNNIRTKLIGLGILPAASTSATLSECYSVLSNVIGLEASSYTPTTTTQTIPSGRYLSGAQTINAIPSAYIIPSGTSNITANNVYDITQYASVSVNVQPALQSKTVTPTQAVQSVTPDAGIYGLSKVTVNAIPSAYIIPSGTVVLSSSGTFDVTSYASADVTVTGGPSGPYVEVVSITTALYGTYVLSNLGSYIPAKLCEGLTLKSIYDLSNVVQIGSDAFNNTIFMYSNIFLNSSVLEFTNLEKVNNRTFFKTSTTYEYIKTNRIYSFPKLSNISTEATAAFCFKQSNSSFSIIINMPILSSISRSYAFGSEGAAKSTISTTFFNSTSYAEIVGAFSNRIVVNAPHLSGTIPVGTFAGQYGIVSLNLDYSNITTISSWAFCGCVKAFSSLTFDRLTSIEFGAFAGTTSLSTVNFPALSRVSTNSYGIFVPIILSSATLSAGIENITAPNLETIYGALLNSCQSIQSINFPKLSYINGNAFMLCKHLYDVSLPKLEYLSGSSAFASCNALSSVYFPELSSINGGQTFMSCEALMSVKFDKLTYLSGVQPFSKCVNLISLFFLASSVCTLGRAISQTFSSTPVSNYSTSAGRWASIFVPSSLLASYKAATNWTTISSKIFAYESYFDANGNPL